ncbi:DUF2244 domain-containing protein [Paracoccus sp. R12_1]|jgi:uncharacterized membrane protein|uniref:DUF2244 domain-containing protein n=1 Tax=unclassified Paracoccus (in: a-proteobacteria) TaxID=2688777 RepID=UPI000C0B4746|nr:MULTISPECIES: DUF2244 domain-containing protein [unclassified Paracoccus (in: a-proteobacteria)]MBO9455525.1 DUF2244 domain-containing protein [Paracoccus sp. R12_2]MBO9486195.1 DUF2244 domain-containing protein [Paracoccus sp. R12_1]PHQ70268.1 MAG: hypothetical protein COB97_05340 [Paracoccus sp. (in: a-proteobacteria)]
MPYEWQDAAPDDSGAVCFRLRAWPYRSLPVRGFVWFIGATAALLALPLLAALGTAVLWGLLPFAALVVWGMWYALQRSYRSGETVEELTLDRQTLWLQRHDAGRPVRQWKTNSYWVRPALRKGPVEDYLTLTDGQREIELGAFLTPEERRALCADLQNRLARLR